MKSVKIVLPKEQKIVEIEILADLHIGSKKCRIEDIRQRIQRIKDEPNVYCVVLGDVLNNSTKGSIGDVYDESVSPREAVKFAIELLRPIKDKILFMTAGNHERRTYRESGDDLCEHIAFGLDILERYDYVSGLIWLIHGFNPGKHFAHANYDQVLTTIYCTHGDGQGGRTIGGKANGLERRGAVIDADIIITGHTHAPLSFRECSYHLKRHEYKVAMHEQLFVNASATLNHEAYAELVGLRPSSVESPRLILEAGKPPKVLI